MKDTLTLRFLYRTCLGRMVLKVLVHPWVSKVAGSVLSSRLSKFFIPHFIKKNNINMDGVIVPEGGFASFNDFFTRKQEIKELDVPYGTLISPCDGLLTPLKIKKDSTFAIKGSRYSMNDLLRNAELARKFEGGVALIFRLTPTHYHRYCYPADGHIHGNKRIDGELHCVRPIALRTLPVFVRNSREYQVIETEEFGTIAQMEVGALMVGKISNHKRPLIKGDVKAGEEKGYFEFGGSTIVLFFQKDAIRLKRSLYSKDHEEIPVKLGEAIGRTNKVVMAVK